MVRALDRCSYVCNRAGIVLEWFLLRYKKKLGPLLARRHQVSTRCVRHPKTDRSPLSVVEPAAFKNCIRPYRRAKLRPGDFPIATVPEFDAAKQKGSPVQESRLFPNSNATQDQDPTHGNCV